MNFKKIIASIMIAAMLFGFTACTGSDGDTASTGSSVASQTDSKTSDGQTSESKPQKMDVTLDVWHQYMPEVQKAIEEAFVGFSEETGIKVNFLKQEDIFKKFDMAIQSGDGPDLFISGNDQVGKFVTMDGIDSIDNKVDKALVSNLVETAVKGFIYQDKLYGLPAHFDTVALIYNKAMVKEPPKTTDDLLKLGADFAKDGKYAVVFPPFDSYFNSAFFYGAGGSFLNDKGEPTIDSPENLNALKFLQDLSQYFPKDLDHQLSTKLFLDEKAAMIISGPWELAKIKEKKIDYGIASLPIMSCSNKPAAPLFSMQGMLLSKDCTEKDAAVLAMQHFASEKVAKALAISGGYIVANNKAYEDSQVSSNADMLAFKKQVEVGVATPNLAELGVLWEPWRQTLQDGVVLKKDAAETLKKHQAAAVAAINNMK